MSRTVVIRGDTLEAWAAALYVKRQMGDLAGQVLVERGTEENDDSPAVIVVRPRTKSFLSALGLTEENLFRKADASFLLGARMNGVEPFILSWGNYGAPANSVPFHHYWKRMADAGKAAPFDHYAFGAELARSGRFVHPASDPKKIESSFDYGYTLDTAAFREVLRREALKLGAGEIGSLLNDPETPWLTLDFTGRAGGSWKTWPDLPGLVSLQEQILERRAENLSVYNVWRETGGALLSLPTRSRSVSRQLTFGCDGGVRTGRLDVFWKDRRVAMGQAAYSLPGLHMPEFTLLQAHLDLLISLLPAEGAALAPLAAEYNRRATRMVDYVADFEVLGLQDPADLRDCSSPTLARKVEQFVSRGRTVTYDDELYSEQEWTAALIAAGLIPERVSPLATGAPLEVVQRNYEGLRRAIGQAASRLPSQEVYLDHLLTSDEGASNAV